ncbi:MAG: hypothetical protein WCC37_01510 [Candidatus Sulfotelmatobacter sp.]
MRWLPVFLLLLSFSPCSQSQDDSGPPLAELNGLSYQEMTRRIFMAEQDMTRVMESSRLITEGYVQSMGHIQYDDLDNRLDEASEYVIDDKYFLAAVNLGHLYDGEPVESSLFARSPFSKYIVTNGIGREKLLPLGQLSMFFVDMTGFDADTYLLKYEARQKLYGVDCMLFSVRPKPSHYVGMFVGDIWVEPFSARIIRIKGVFTDAKAHPRLHYYRGRYFAFDSWREHVGDLWLPTIAYFNDSRVSRSDGNLLNHYRGYTVVWQHQRHGAGSRGAQNDAVALLDNDGLLATPGTVERSLEGIVRRLAVAGKVPSDDIQCRVLLTTPAEIFSVGKVIIISRGLLNIVPDESVLAVLIARQMAHIMLGHSHGSSREYGESIFELNGKHDFQGLDIHRTPAEEEEADREATVLLNGSVYKNALPSAKVFLSLLKNGSNRVPNLLLARFGPSLTPKGSSFADLPSAALSDKSNTLYLRNKYNVSWNGALVMSTEQGEPADAEIDTKQVASHPPLAQQ